MKTLLLESVAGVAGDMFTAAFLDAGLVDAETLSALPGLLGLRDVEVVPSQRTTGGMRATHIDVAIGGDAGAGHGSTYRAIDRLLADSRLDQAASEFARRVFRLMAEAEADAHGVAIENVHFHEVGAIDSIVDVAMAGLCVTTVRPDRVLATPVKLGRGSILIQHGRHAVPPPASARLARGFRIAEVPAEIAAPDIELSTPTGLAILKALRPTFTEGWPAGTLLTQGMGCGTVDLDPYPNTFRVVLLEDEALLGDDGTAKPLPYLTDRVVEICCNIDDEPAERTAWAAGQLLSAGALDVWTTPVTGKKGRSAVCMSVLATPADWARIADWILRRTSTFGVRYRTWDRLKLDRSSEERELDGERVRFKVGRTSEGEVLKEKPEFEDMRRTWEKGD